MSAKSMTDLLRSALRQAPSLNAVEQATGVKRQSLAKFMRGDQSLRLDLADRLAKHFGLEVRPAARTKTKGPKHG